MNAVWTSAGFSDQYWVITYTNVSLIKYVYRGNIMGYMWILTFKSQTALKRNLSENQKSKWYLSASQVSVIFSSSSGMSNDKTLNNT